MHRNLFTAPYIGSYSVLLLAGFFFGYLLARWRGKKNNIEGRHLDNLVLLLLVITPAGARFFNRLFYHPTKLSFWEALKIWEGGGLVFYGGLIIGILTVIIYARVMRLSLFTLSDVLAPSLALGLVFGRIGCFLSGCCWGDICAKPEQLSAIKEPLAHYQVQTFPSLCPPGFLLAVRFPYEAGAYEQHKKLGLIPKEAARSMPVHPIQLYESFLVLVLCVLLNRAFRQRHQPGEIFLAFGMSYGLIRFCIEFLRADSAPVYFGGMTISQVISLIIAVSCLLFFLAGRRSKKKIVLPIGLEPAA